MQTPRDRLKYLLELAAAPDTRAALKHELEALLADWPEDYPQSARTTFVMLLEKVTQEAAQDEDSERAIVAALRSDDRDRVITILARAAHAGEEVVWHALSEESGEELASLCREAGLSRAAYSSLILLLGQARGRPGKDVERMLQNYDATQEALAAE